MQNAQHTLSRRLPQPGTELADSSFPIERFDLLLRDGGDRPGDRHGWGGIEAQTEQALVNLAAVVKAAGISMDDLVKTTIFYANVEDFARLDEVSRLL